MEQVILVDEKDKKIGTAEKLKAHQKGLLHRAISVFIFNKKGQVLIQKRSKRKYHSGDLWANTCCTHPRPGEKAISAAKRRLKEEMGIEAELRKIMKICYHAKVGKLIENEADHVFMGFFDGEPKINKKEVEDWKWVDLKELLLEVRNFPEKYAIWFRLILPSLLKKLKLKNDFK